MPKDIRSYFSASFKPAKKTENKAVEDGKINRKRKKLIVLSDSDDEPAVKSPKKEIKTPASKKSDEGTSKYFEVSKDTVHKLFGNSPVKRKNAPSKSKNNEIDDLVCVIDDDSNDTWEKSFVNDSKNTSKNTDEIVAKKRKLNDEPDSSNNGKTDNNITNDGVTKSLQNGRRNDKRKESVTPEKKSSPSKLKTSPQKSIISYLSPEKGSPSRFNKLEITKTSKSPKINDKIISKNTENEKLSKNKETVKNKIKYTEHDLSPEKNDKNKLNIKSSPEISPKKIQCKPTDHSISPDNSDDECESKISNNIPKVTIIEKKVSKPVIITKPQPSKLPSPNLSEFNLWVEKYKPVSLKNIIGQQGEKSCVNKLLKWLKNWFENQSGNKKIARPSPWAKDDSGAYFKAALLSGPPGIGKTTTAHLVCKELNMDVVEFNASDTRSKKLLSQEVGELLSSKTLSTFMQGEATSRNHVLVMDEVDGMAGNEDRGGIQELILLIKNSKVPIICMCNDRNHPKIRSLVNYCFDLRFNRPRVDQIKGAMLSICYKENLKVKPEVLTEIISSTNQDIRLTLNHLSMLASKKEQSMNITQRDLKLGPWDVARKVFSHEEHKSMSIHDKCDLFFNDYGIAPLFVQENYLNVVPYSDKGKSKVGKMELFAEAANSLCYGDMTENAIRSFGAWSLLPTQAVFSSLIPGDILSGRVGGMINFPSWLGKNSKKNKMDRLCQEIQVHTRLRVSASKEAICTDYAYKLRDGIVTPLINFGSEGVTASLQFLHDYNLLREDMDSLSELTAWPDSKDLFSSLDSKVKAAFTRAYNKNPVLAPFSISNTFKKGRKGNNEDNDNELLINEEASEGVINQESDQEDDDLSADGMIIVKKKQTQENQKKDKTKQDKPSSSKPRGGKRGKK
ncbi:hypothetical protein O3M35_009700 [Rhynocoris fuscipes]|uniref:Activator 1 large subunit n=1 Tax=Rhynocoris fuscipes TaxID=488301 RepID=A0AAW1DBG6_9HEMI